MTSSQQGTERRYVHLVYLDLVYVDLVHVAGTLCLEFV